MQISDIELYFVKIPLALKNPGFFRERPYFEPSWIPGFRQSEVRMYLLRLSTDNGLEGVAAMPGMGAERLGLGPLLGQYLLGMDPLDIALVNQRIQEFSYIGMRNGWIDAAFWDIIGKSMGQPLWKLLGGTGGHVYPYLSSGSTHNHNPEKAQDLAKSAIDQGYKGLKLRVKSPEIAPMTEYVAAARAAAGPNLRIMVDANQGWPVDIVDKTPRWSVEFAIQFARSIENFNVYWLEEPLNRGNFEGLAELRKSTSVPIAGSEMNSTWRDFKAMLALHSLDIFQPDAVLVGGTFAGGISVTKWTIDAIRAYNAQITSDSPKEKVRFSPHTWTTGIGYTIGLHLVGLLGDAERSLLEYPLEGHWRPECWGGFIKNLAKPGADGKIRIPEEPGLGLEIDWKMIRKFGKRIYKGNKASISRSVLLDRGLKSALYLKEKKEAELKSREAVRFQVPLPPF